MADPLAQVAFFLPVSAIFEDVGVRRGIRLKTDASAAKGISNRKGLGKVRHLEVTQLWLQEKVATGVIKVQKVDGKVNQADALTKYVSRDELEQHMRQVGLAVENGRHELMPKNDAKEKSKVGISSEAQEDPGDDEPDAVNGLELVRMFCFD